MKSPLSTYRLQVNADFPFASVAKIIDYLRDLGVGTLYFSPVFKARPRSPHGYDVTDPSKFSADAGDEAQFTALSKAAAEAGMSIMLDIVPNHMAAAEDNPWWHDILEHGAATTSADFFDVDWQAPGANNRIVLPILGAPIEEVVRKGEIRLELRDGDIRVVYFSRALPLDPNSYATIFEITRHNATGRTAEAALELAGMARNIPVRAQCTGDKRAERKRITREIKASIREKLSTVNGLQAALQTAVTECSRPEAHRCRIETTFDNSHTLRGRLEVKRRDQTSVCLSRIDARREASCTKKAEHHIQSGRIRHEQRNDRP